MKKSEIISYIFGETKRAQNIESRKSKISLQYMLKCLDFYKHEETNEESKENAKEFIYRLLMR